MIIDPQVNGGFCNKIVDFSSPNLSHNDVLLLAKKYKELDTYLIPTLITADHQMMLKNIQIIVEAIGDDEIFAGIHLEGPYLTKKHKTSHPDIFLREPNLKEFLELFKIAKEKIVLTTVTPEYDSSMKYINEISELGVTVSIGHFSTNFDSIKKAKEAGATAFTHAGNAWKYESFDHKSTEVYDLLREPEMFVMVIPDLRHVSATFLRMCKEITSNNKNISERLIFTSDASPAEGAPKGKYKVFTSLEVEVVEDEKNNKLRTLPLSGSHLNLRDCINLMQKLKLDKTLLFTENEIKTYTFNNTFKMLEKPLKRIGKKF